MSSSDKPVTPQGNPRRRWTIGVLLAGAVVIAVTVPVITIAFSPQSNPTTESESKQDSSQPTEPDDDEPDEAPDRAEAECEADEGNTYESISPSGDYLVSKKDGDLIRHHDGDTTKMVDVDDDPGANTFDVSAVNSSGVAVGAEHDVADPTKGWRYADGEHKELSLPDGWKGKEDRGVEPTGVNDDGVVVGYVEGESDGKDRAAPAKWEPDSETPTLLDGDKDGAAKAIDGDTVIGYEEDGDEQQLVKWDSDGSRKDWDGPKGADLDPYGLSGDWTVYETQEAKTVRLNVSNDKEDTLPSDFTAADLDEDGKAYGTYDTGHAGYVDPDGKEHEIPLPDEDEKANAADPDASDEGGAKVQYVVRGISSDGDTLVGARQETDGEGYHDNGGDDADGDGSGDPGRVWDCES